MEEDIDTRKINNSFLRDHSYATEGNGWPSGLGGKSSPGPLRGDAFPKLNLAQRQGSGNRMAFVLVTIKPKTDPGEAEAAAAAVEGLGRKAAILRYAMRKLGSLCPSSRWIRTDSLGLQHECSRVMLVPNHLCLLVTP